MRQDTGTGSGYHAAGSMRGGNIMRQDTGIGSDELRILQLGWMLFLEIFSDKDKELELIQDDCISPIP